MILYDLKMKAEWCYGSSRWTHILRAAVSDGTLALVLYRLMQFSRKWRLVPFELLFNKLNVMICHCIIGRGAEFGPGLIFIHSTGIVIHGSVRGGSHVYIEHQVTIGAERSVCPILGSHIFIGAGAKIIGSVRVGDGARIGANAVVVHDVPAHATAVGVPARIIQRAPPGDWQPMEKGRGA